MSSRYSRGASLLDASTTARASPQNPFDIKSKLSDLRPVSAKNSGTGEGPLR